MDFPRTATTNIHKIEGILFIQWTVYGLEQSRQSLVGDVKEHLEWPLNPLQVVEHELRHNGHHVLHNASQDVLWVFDLSGPNVKKESRNEHQQGTFSIIDRHGLKKLLFGSLRASDLVDMQGRIQRVSIQSHHELDALVNLFGFDKKVGGHRERAAAIIQDNMSIHDKIISAISMSISYLLARRDGYTPLSSNLFLDMRPFEVRPFKTTLENSFSFDSYEALRQEIQWLSCGSLVILTYPDLRTRWASLGFNNILGPEPNDIEIILAPVGIRASLRWPKVANNLEPSTGAIHPALDADGLEQDLKAATTAFLKQRGIVIKDSCRWLWLRIPSSNDGLAHIDMRDSQRVFQWPAHLCFYQRRSILLERDRTSWLWSGLSDINADPLKDAERWFLEKDDRDRLIEQRRQEIAAQDKRKNQALRSKEDIFGSGMFSAIDRQIDIQGLSGIYPTPPDGFRSQGAGQHPEQDILNANEQQEDAEMLDQTQQHEDTMKEESTSMDPLSNAGMSLGTYDDIEDDDLFGNMHSAMYTANGITEDDFSFFDEPKEPIGRPLASPMTASPVEEFLSCEPAHEKPFSSLHTAEEDCEMLMKSEDDDWKRGIHSPAQDARRVGTLSTSDDQAVQERSQPNTGIDIRDVFPTVDLDETMDISNEVEIRRPTPESEYRTQVPSFQKHGAFASMPWKTEFKAVDFKYANEGKFFVEKYQREGSPPSKSHDVAKSIPVLGYGIGHDSGSSSERGDGSDITSPSISTTCSEPVADITTKSDTQNLTIESETNLPKLGLGNSLRGDQHKSLTETNLTSLSMLVPSDTAVNFMEDHASAQQTSATLLNRLYTGRDAKFIQIAQILADQLVVYSTPGKYDRSHTDVEMFTSSFASYYDDPLSWILPAIFPQSEACTVEACASIGEALRGMAPPPKTAIRPPPRKLEPMRANLDLTNASPFIFNAGPPDLRVLRKDKVMELSATGLQFWEELGLSPSLGPKDVIGFCIYPAVDMVHRGVESFMDVLSITYQSLRLGIHDWGYESSDEFPDGLVPFTLNHESMEITISAIDATCERLGQLVAEERSSESTIVVYIVNPFSVLSLLPRLCESFLKCLDSYQYSISTSSRSDTSTVVLKVISIDWVASRTTIPIPLPKAYASLARNIYDRCPADSAPTAYTSASLVQLAKTIPKTVDFRLSTNPLSIIAQNSTVLHIAYSWRSGSQWLCISVTDKLGTIQWNASYCFGTTIFNPWPSFREIAKEIWEGSLEMIDGRDNKRTIYVVKDEPMAQEEMEVWMSLASTSDQSSISLVLLCAEPSPPIYHSSIPSFTSPPEDLAFYATPESTPAATAQTPDNLASPGYASGFPRTADASDLDSNARLIDVVDESWGVIATKSLITSNYNLGTAHPVGCGYLLKRAGTLDENGWVVMRVYVLHAETWSDALMKELLLTYRALGTLARARGVEDEVRSVLPLHIAIARKTQSGLDKTMRFR